eukprot:12902390-Ditylum_brightwellii.AAC.1
MRIVQDVSREASQLVTTKKSLILFKVEEGSDQKLGESRMYKLFTQPEEDNSPVYLLAVEVFELVSTKEWLIFKKQVKQVLKGQNAGNMDAAYTLVQDLLRGGTLTVFNNKRATFKEQMWDNLDHCLNAMTAQVFPNKV